MNMLDIQMAAISAWLKANRITAHVDRNQRITLRDKQTGKFVYKEETK